MIINNNNNNNRSAQLMFLLCTCIFYFRAASCGVIKMMINGSAVSFLSGLGRRIAEVLGETLECSFLFQRLNVLIKRFNAVLLQDCFVDEVAGHSS